MVPLYAMHDLLDEIAHNAHSDAEILRLLDAVAAHLIAAVAPLIPEPAALSAPMRALGILSPTKSQKAAPQIAKILDDNPDIPSLVKSALQLLAKPLDGTNANTANAANAANAVLIPEGQPWTLDEIAALDQASNGKIALLPLAKVVHTVMRALLALDDLVYALSLPPYRAQPAAAAVVALALARLPHIDGKIVPAWLKHRGARPEVEHVWHLRHTLTHLSPADVDCAAQQNCADLLALWLLAMRLADLQSLDSKDRPALEALCQRARLVPLEVFDAASLWNDLNPDLLDAPLDEEWDDIQ